MVDLKQTKYRFMRPVLSAVFAFLSVIALKYSCNNNIASIFDATDTSSWSYTIVFAALTSLYYKALAQKQEKSRDICLLSGILTFCMFVGNALRYNKDFSFTLYSTAQKAITLLSVCGWFLLFFFLLNALVRCIARSHTTSDNTSDNPSMNCRQLFWLSSLCMLICWLPYLIAAFPGSISYDGGTQLAQAAGYLDLTNHHPILGTYILKFFLYLGRALSSESAGMFLFVIVQTVILIFSIASAIVEMHRLHAPKWLLLFTLLFFSLFSLWPMYAQWIVKDTLHAAVTLLFVVYAIRAARKEYSHTFPFYSLWLVWGVLTALTRNDGVYIVAITLLILLSTQKTIRRKGIVLLAAFLCINTLWNVLVIDANGITKSSKKEMLSIPFQQTANYVRCYGAEITDEEKEIIDRVLDYDTLPQRYNPSLADAVKESYRLTGADDESEALAAYFKVWFKEFLHHPVLYFKTTLANTYDYYYIENQHVVMTSHVHIGHESIMEQYQDKFDLNQPDSLGSARSFFNQLYYWQITAPVTGVFDCTGFYTWIYLTLAMLMIHFKKKKSLAYLTSPIVVILICIVSPVNGTTRYMLPAMIMMPLMVAFTLDQIRPDTVK